MMRVVLFYLLAARALSVKIDAITTSIMKDGHVFVEIKAGNLSGWGQASYNNEQTDLYDTIGDKIHTFVGVHAIGEDFNKPEDIDAFQDKVWQKNYKRTGTVLAQALAGVDTALWDIVAKSQGMSVCSLIARELGSVCKTHMPVYGSNGDRTKSPAEIVANAVHNRDAYGIRAFKFQIENRMGNDVDIKPGRTEALIPLARQQLGPNITLMVDANGGIDNYTHAQRVAQLLVDYNYTWFEEPFPFWEYDKAKALGEEFSPRLGIALGEQEFRLDVWQRNIDAMRYAQPDVHYIGGVSRTLRVAQMSMARGANSTFVPHSPNPCMVDIFALSMLAAVPNAWTHMEFDAINTRHPPSGDDFFVGKPFSINDGLITVPTGDGWGVVLKPGLLINAYNQTSTSKNTNIMHNI